MIGKRRITAQFVMLALALGTAACSKDAGSDGNDVAEANAADVTPLFAQGFEEGGQAPPKEVEQRDTVYEPDPGIRRKMNRHVADNLRRNFSIEFVMPDPEEFLRSGAAGDVADRKLEALGLPANDVASATVLMFGTAWELANQQKLTPAMRKGLLKQIDKKFVDEPMRESLYQQEAEARLLIAAIWLEEARLRRNSPDRMRELSDAVHRDMKRLSNNDVRAHKATEAGFVDR